MKDHHPSPDLIGQNTVKLISNVGFSVFVFSVLTFTVIAITYQPPDPWESSRALTRVFTEISNATFQLDNSIVKTGEDLDSAAPLSPSPSPSPPLARTNPLVENSGQNITNPSTSPSPTPSLSLSPGSGLVSSPSPSLSLGPSVVSGPSPSLGVVSGGCDDTSFVNCSAHGVLNAIKKFNAKRFKSIVFLEYQTPVNGSGPNECDVSWKYRNKKERSWRKYRDFRRFRLAYGENCTYKVVAAKGWHSGTNAKLSRSQSQSQQNGTKKGRKSKIMTPFRDDEINDTIPVMGSGSDFRTGKYLYYSRGGDYCKNMNQYIWSLLCALGEAKYLNRTFVMDLSVCLSAKHTSSKHDEDGKDFRFYFDFEHLKETASIVEQREFVKDWKKYDKNHKKKIAVRKVRTYKVTPMQLRNDTSTIIWRRFEGPEPENYWYRVCENQAAYYIKRPWQSLWKSKRLMNIVSEISGQMDWDYDAVHVIRGEKAQNKAMWPHLNEDTSPESLVSKLQGVVQPWRNLYIATNEPFYNHFDRLRSYYKVHLLDDYKELWGNKSEWYNETMALNGGRPVEFDGYMRAEVDTEVLYRAKIRVETFYNLTKDCKDGINTC